MGQPELRDAPTDNNPAGPSSSPIDATHFDYRSWTTQDGLPENSVTSIIQTRDGYLWIGTFGGLARFDGVRFTVFDMANTAALGTNRINEILQARNGHIWIASSDVIEIRQPDGHDERDMDGEANDRRAPEMLIVFRVGKSAFS